MLFASIYYEHDFHEKKRFCEALPRREGQYFRGGRNMQKESKGDYNYEMVVNTVAEMVVQYLKSGMKEKDDEAEKIGMKNKN